MDYGTNKKSKNTSDDDRELQNLVQEGIDDAISYIDADISTERGDALKYYLRMPYGNEVEGRSQVVTGEVAEAVDGAMPALMRIFTQSSDSVVFEPVNKGDEETAESITSVVNHVFSKDNNGHFIMHQWFWDALVQKVGVVKAYWNDAEDTTIEEYNNLTEEELGLVLSDDELSIKSQETNEMVIDTDPVPVVDQTTGEQMMDDMGQPVMESGEPLIETLYSVKLNRTINNSRVKIENVAPEEFLIDRRATCINSAGFVAQRSLLTRAELVQMGYDQDVVDNLATDDNIDLVNSSEFANRYADGLSPNLMSTSSDETQQRIQYFECYIDVGNKDGTATKHRVCYAGDTILHDEECDYVPFYTLCPFPIPHTFYGRSLADRTMDLQLIKSTITRQMLDNLYLTNNSRVGAVEGQVNLDDLLTSTAGGVIRMKNPNALVPLTVQSSAAQSFPMLEYLDNVQAKRTGVSDISQGLDANILQNVSATAVAAMTTQSQGKLELIARTFADTGVKDLFLGIFHLLCKYQDKERTIKINKEYVPFSPREWDTQYSVSVNVGLGHGSKQERVAMLQMILAKQEQIIQQYGVDNPLVNIKQYRETLGKFINLSGFEDDAVFLNDITEEQNQQLIAQAQEAGKQPAAEVQAAQAIADAEIQKAQMKAQNDAAELELKAKQIELDSAKAMLELQQDKLQFEKEMALKEIEMATKAEESIGKENQAEMKLVLDAVDKINKINTEV